MKLKKKKKEVAAFKNLLSFIVSFFMNMCYWLELVLKSHQQYSCTNKQKELRNITLQEYTRNILSTQTQLANK